MRQIDLVKCIRCLAKDHNKKIFTLRELAGYARVSRPAAGMSLLRAMKNNVVSRVANRWINLMDPPSLEEIAFSMASPSYVSFESALYQHGILSQSPRGYLSVAVRGRPGEVATPLGKIRFTHLKAPLFFGFGADRMAYPEKAWLDLLYIRGRQGREAMLSEEIDRSGFNKKRLREFEKKFPGWVTQQGSARDLWGYCKNTHLSDRDFEAAEIQVES